MVCSFCKGKGLHGGEKAGNKNIRTCDSLKVAAAVFLAHRADVFDLESFKSYAIEKAITLGCSVLADCLGGCGAMAVAEGAEVLNDMYNWYSKASDGMDMVEFAKCKGTRAQGAYLIANGFGYADVADAIAGEIAADM